ncbi:MAG: serine hydrolase domain-containing protein [Bacteroidota bacterium]
MPHLRIISLFFLLSLWACKTEKNTQPSSVDQEFEELFSKSHEADLFHGTALIFKEGQEVYKGAFGFSNAEAKTPMKVENIFRLASVSKQFTCMTIMLLKEQGKLDYDQDIRDFIPELPYEGITIRHLMQHTSGIPDYVSLFEENWKTDLAEDDPERFIEGNEHIISMVAEKKPERHFAPGEKWEYSNMAYVTLAVITARVSGMPFADFAKQNIFDPLGMENTSYYDFIPGPDPHMPLRTFGFYKDLDGSYKPNDSNYLNPAKGDGGIYSTVDDLLKWDRALYTDKLVSKESLEEAFTPGKLANGDTHHYGFGWGIGESPNGKKVVSHSGGWVGYRTFIYREIEEDNCIILLSNNSSNSLGKVLDQAKNILHGKAFEIPKESPTVSLGKTLYNEGVEEGLQAFQELKDEFLAIKADNPWALAYELEYLAETLVEKGKSKEAIEVYKMLIDFEVGEKENHQAKIEELEQG